MKKILADLESVFLSAQSTLQRDVISLLSEVLDYDFSLSDCVAEIYSELYNHTGDEDFSLSLMTLYEILPVGCPLFYEKALTYIAEAKARELSI